MSAPSRPTLAHVAAAAGVSLKTASRAMNGEYGVAAATSARVLQAARDLGFRPNHLARSLAAGRQSAAVGLVISSVADPFIAAVTGAVETVVGPRDLHLVIASHGDDAGAQRTIVRALMERRVDVLLLIPAPGDASYLQTEINHGVVVVSMDRPLTGVDVDTVTIDNRAAAAQAVRDFAAAGHRRIALLGSDIRLWTLHQRLQGYLDGLQDCGLPHDPELVQMRCQGPTAGQDELAAMLALPDPPTAVLAVKNTTGRGVIRAMRAAGIALDLTIFDELDPELLAIPPRVVESGPDRMGSTAAAMAMERLDGLAGPARHVVLPTRVVEPGHQPGTGQPGAGQP